MTSSSIALLTRDNGNYERLNVIPQRAKSKMDKEELAIWKKMSSRFYIDYSFLDTEYYQENKFNVLERMLRLYDVSVSSKKGYGVLQLFYNNALARTKVGRGIYGTETVYYNTAYSDEDTTDYTMGGTRTVYKSIVCPVGQVDSVNVEIVFTSFLNISGTDENPSYEWYDYSYFVVPEGAEYRGGVPNMYQNGDDLHISAQASIWFESREFNFNINENIPPYGMPR